MSAAERFSTAQPFVLASSRSEEERKDFDRRRKALWEYQNTGDPTEMIALGIFPEDTPHKETALMKQRREEG